MAHKNEVFACDAAFKNTIFSRPVSKAEHVVVLTLSMYVLVLVLPPAPARASPSSTLVGPAPERKRASLIDRLAAAGFGRKTERAEPEAPAARAPVQAPSEPRQSVETAMTAPMAHQDFAKRPALQPQPQNQSRTFEDDQLEIPAFLRRQSH